MPATRDFEVPGRTSSSPGAQELVKKWRAGDPARRPCARAQAIIPYPSFAEHGREVCRGRTRPPTSAMLDTRFEQRWRRTAC